MPNAGVSYVITDWTPLPTLSFSGAPEFSFDASVHINVTTAKLWLQQMMDHSKCTYRYTKGRSAGLKRVLFKAEMHCQHQQKMLTSKQKQLGALARCKNAKKSLMHDVRNKKTGCPSKLTLTVKVPTKSDKRAAKRLPFLLTHLTILKISFTHNHPLDSAHVLSFRPISAETKELIFEYFCKGHSVSSAHHWHETKLFLDSDDQLTLADRNNNPTKPDFSRLYDEWRKKEMGSDNGKSMFNQLETEISTYNDANCSNGGKAIMQIFKGVSDSSESELESENDDLPKKKRKKKMKREQPLVVAVCTPLMSRIHQYIQQSSEMIFCDSTSSLDRFNSSLFVLSTSHSTGGLPLSVMITSDEQEDTIQQGLEMVKQVLPAEAFYDIGAKRGPGIIMTDDSSAERNALQHVWPNARLLLCVFHFLQSKWTWLHNSKNQIADTDRQLLMMKTKQLVYAKSESQLISLYSEFQKCKLVKKYPQYLTYIQSHWSCRKEWALCYRTHLLVRGNHTNNYAEAGVRIVKKLIFNRVKAYNIIQMFTFVTECLELYYTRKLLSVAHNRIDCFVSLKYQGINCACIGIDKIQIYDKTEQTYLVESQSERGVRYLVDMSVGVCSCTGGQDGSPCSHQAAIVRHYRVPSINSIPTLSPLIRQEIATIALGTGAIQNHQFYASLHQEKQETKEIIANDTFGGTAWDLVEVDANKSMEEDNNEGNSEPNQTDDIADLTMKIDEFAADIKSRVQDTPLMAQAMKTFLRRYSSITQPGTLVNARLSSALHRFGWTFGGATQSSHGGYFCKGRRIPVNAKSAGRRCRKFKKGKGKVLQGRPKGMKIATSSSVYDMPIRNEPKGKRKHSIQKNIIAGVQNGGKW